MKRGKLLVELTMAFAAYGCTVGCIGVVVCGIAIALAAVIAAATWDMSIFLDTEVQAVCVLGVGSLVLAYTGGLLGRFVEDRLED